jgi:mono/diheme cytochrome c family protein
MRRAVLRTRTLTRARAVAGRAAAALTTVMVAGVVVAGAAQNAPPAGTSAIRTPTASVDRGKDLYVRYGCYQCHGREAQGASTGPRLGPGPRPLGEFSEYVRDPSGEMPPYTAKILTDVEMADIYAFVASRPKPASRPTLLRPR